MTHKLSNLANKHVAHGRIGLEGPESGNRTARMDQLSRSVDLWP